MEYFRETAFFFSERQLTKVEMFSSVLILICRCWANYASIEASDTVSYIFKVSHTFLGFPRVKNVALRKSSSECMIFSNAMSFRFSNLAFPSDSEGEVSVLLKRPRKPLLQNKNSNLEARRK